MGRLTLVQWLVCATAAIGFAFDTYELLMLPLVLRPALQELIGAAPGSPEFQMWLGRLFFIPAFAGGIFGLLGGWLTDRFGRRRVLAGSIFLYAGSAFVAGYSTSVEMLLICRCLVFIGVCVEFVAAIAWLSELFDDPKRREAVIGYTQAFGSIGGLMVAVINSWLGTIELGNMPFAAQMASMFGEIKDPNAVWRYTLMSGLIPAIPLVILRPFLPESPKWKEKKLAGTLKRPSIMELFKPELRRTTILTTLLVGASFGLAFGGVQQIPQIVPNLPEVKEAAAKLPPPEARKLQQKAGTEYTKIQEFGGLTGRIVMATLAIFIVSRRLLLATFAIPALFVLPFLFYQMANGHSTYYGEWMTLPISTISFWVFMAGFLIVGQFSFWGNYLPRVFPLHLRGTGESMAANVGGRMLGTSFAWVTATFLATKEYIPGANPPGKMGYSAAIVVGGLSLFIVVLLWALREPNPATEEGH